MRKYTDRKRLIEETVHTFIQENSLLADGKKCLLAVSGGADSVCLLRLMCEYAKDCGTKLMVFHYNHHLRGEAADQDEEFVRSLCEKYQLPFYAKGGDVGAFAAENKMGIEEAARHLRYEALYQVAEEAQADLIALAHHKNDQAETVLFNLCRGTGLAGLSGMKEKNGRLIRPLLCLSRDEIEEYLACIGQHYMTDETNADTGYSRNLIRAKVLPLLQEQVNEKTVQHIYEAADICAQALEFIQEQAKQALRDCMIGAGEGDQNAVCDDPAAKAKDAAWADHDRKMRGLRVSIPVLQTYPSFLQQEVVRLAIFEVAGSKKDIGSIHVQSVLSLMEKQSGRRISLPYQMEAVRSYQRLLIFVPDAADTGFDTADPVSENTAKNITESVERPRSGSGSETNMQQAGIRFEKADFVLTKENASLIPREGNERWIDADKAGDEIRVRTPERGDYFFLDDTHKKYIRDYFSDQKIPAFMRGKKLLVTCGHHVLCIPGERISYPVRITEKTRRILKIIRA
ncbi:MAG: tRNA lysidine(34) synthetase TilS [Lachnospiraceae bacterium]|nr:tRNA lysidine(34) synthetase TilS [Lachnospiraceae bacterium]